MIQVKGMFYVWENVAGDRRYWNDDRCQWETDAYRAQFWNLRNEAEAARQRAEDTTTAEVLLAQATRDLPERQQ